jgi:Aspartyl protease
MTKRRRFYFELTIAAVCALLVTPYANATGVPIGGFLPTVGIALTNEFLDDLDTNAYPSSAPSGILLGQGGTAHYDIALMDTGAALSLLTAQSHFDFKMDGPYPGEPDGFHGTEPQPITGATGSFDATIDDPVGLYAGGLQGVTSTSPLTINHSVLEGQTNTSLATMPAGTELPNILGLPFVSQYATYIRNDLPQIHQINGRTVRSPFIEFNANGGSSQGLSRRAFVSLDPGASFAQPPFWFYNIENFDIDNPHENPSIPTAIQGGIFLTTNLSHDGTNINNNQFLMDTGADVTVLSEQIAYAQLGLDPDNPDFTVAVTGSGGTTEGIPGYFLDSFTIQASGGGGNLTLMNVPIVVLDVITPVDGTNTLPGIVGMNVFAGRNMVINPKAGTVAAGVYIGDPVTTSKNWTTTAASGTWSTGGNWSGGTAPNNLGIANVRHVSGGNQVAELTATTTVWEVNVSGSVSQTMTLNVQNGVRLTTFSGINIESNGILQLSGGTLDAQFVEIFGGTLRGSGLVTTGSGSIPGQVESRGGTVSPGNGIGTLSIEGRFANAEGSTLAIELGGLAAGTQYDQLLVDGGAALDGTLSVSLVGFTPFVGDTFTILAADAIGGQFSALSLPGAYQWDVDYGATDVVLSVIGPGLAGDFNSDNKVDMADYVVWRKSDGSPQRYETWRSHYGNLPGGGSSVGGTSVPEPATLLLIVCAMCGFAATRRKRVTRCARF